jgi:hypothetical protein
MGAQELMADSLAEVDNTAAEAFFHHWNGKYCPAMNSVIPFTRGR